MKFTVENATIDILQTTSHVLRLIWMLFLWWCIFSLFKTKQDKNMKLKDLLTDIAQQAIEVKAGSHKRQNAINVMKQEAKYGHKTANFYGPKALDESDIKYFQDEGLHVVVDKESQITTISWK